MTALPPYQKRLYDKLVNDIERDQLSKALRSAEAILGVFPDHVQTLAMKGLILHKLKETEEAFELIKKAISLNAESTSAWLCLATCHLSDKNYVDALKALKQGLLREPQSSGILRDMSSVTIQLRDWDQFLEVAQKLVVMSPHSKAHWIALSCAHKMLGNPKIASEVLERMPSLNSAQPVEDSELALYRTELALEAGEPRTALNILKEWNDRIVDDIAKLFLRAQIHTAFGQKQEAEQRYMELIRMGISEGDCVAKIARLRKIPLDEDLRPKAQVDQYMALVDGILSECPRSDYIRRHALDCTPLDVFEDRLSAFCADYMRRLVPSLWSVLKSLYRFPERSAIIEKLFLQWEDELQSGTCTSFGKTNPCHLLWVWTMLATHYRRVGDYQKAHQFIDKAIAHTPTLEHLHLEKGRIYSREGNTKAAAEYADHARGLDLQDKYLNSKAAKMFFRDNNIEQGEFIMSLFYAPDPLANYVFLSALESQCYWYEKEVGEAFYRRGDIYAALQSLLMFEKHHLDNHNELYDFHPYVFRRCTIRYWFDVLRCDENMGENKFFLKMCPCLVRCYMRVHELGEAAVRAAHVPRPEVKTETLAEKDVKRIAQLREKFLNHDVDLSEPLKKAERYLSFLLKNRTADPRTHLLAIEYYTLIGKPLLVSRALLSLKKQKFGSVNEEAKKFEEQLLERERGNLNPRIISIIEEVLQIVKAG